jgi:hypothetical protein
MDFYLADFLVHKVECAPQACYLLYILKHSMSDFNQKTESARTSQHLVMDILGEFYYMKNFKKLACALVLSGFVGAVQAASVSLTPSSPSVNLNSTVSFDVILDFSLTPVTSGNFNLNYDTTRLDLSSFSYKTISGVTTWAVDTLTDGVVKDIVFSGPISGPITLGTVTFLATGLGNANLLTVAAAPGFYDGGDYIIPGYGGASAQISAVPVPAAVWLMASGLLGVVGLSRRT